MPAITRPGARLASVAISIAVMAGLRATAGRMPMPTVVRSVRANAVAASEMAAVKKQSSMTHIWSSPPDSTRSVNSMMEDGGNVRSKHTPS